MKKENRLDRIDQNIAKAKRAIDKHRRKFAAFDAMSDEEKRRATANGLNPYEPKHVRDRKQAAIQKEIDRHIRTLPKDVQEELRSLGVFGDCDGQVIRRTTGAIGVK